MKPCMFVFVPLTTQQTQHYLRLFLSKPINLLQANHQTGPKPIKTKTGILSSGILSDNRTRCSTQAFVAILVMVCVAQVRALSPEVWCVVKTSLKRIMIKVIQGEYPARTKTNHRITGILSIWTWPCFGQGWCFKPHNSLQNISDSPSKRVNRFLIELLFSFQA